MGRKNDNPASRIYLHVTAASWWHAAELGEALGGLKKFVLPWFPEWGRQDT